MIPNMICEYKFNLVSVCFELILIICYWTSAKLFMSKDITFRLAPASQSVNYRIDFLMTIFYLFSLLC